MEVYGATSVSINEVLVNNTVTAKSQSDIEDNDSEINFSERLKICCKPKYQPRILRNKGALLVLVWNFLVTTVFYYVYYESSRDNSFCNTCFKLILVPVGIALLFSGWLADVYFERYKVLRWSIIIMWISSLLLTTTFVVEEMVTFTNYYQLVFLSSLGIGYGMFQANILQFGLDQLTDSSTDEIVSFVYWYAFSAFGSAISIQFLLVFTTSCSQYNLMAPLMVCMALSVVASSLFLCNKVFTKEPVSQNPFKLIYRVLKYAFKHKYAHQRSAFTYCEDELPSRLDFGKSKYGGPFTTEQVEDVKTFLRCLSLILTVTFIFGIKAERSLYMHMSNKAWTDKENSLHKHIQCTAYTFFFPDLIYIIYHCCDIVNTS